MISKPPFFAQEGTYTCALACLRMVLAQHDISVTEEELGHSARFEGYGIHIEEVVRLAHQFGLRAEIQGLDLAAVSGLLARGNFPIVFVDRAPIDGEFAIHTVIPVRVNRKSVVCLDPLFGERRIPRKLFERASAHLDQAAVVCTSQ
jgi:ABC-type bacteriocin/lantibiotic exporter with double-glycine peptidase domain